VPPVSAELLRTLYSGVTVIYIFVDHERIVDPEAKATPAQVAKDKFALCRRGAPQPFDVGPHAAGFNELVWQRAVA
jgi:hypothetical protein